MLISVKFGSMDAAVGQINSRWNQLEAEFGDLQSSVNRLLGTWDGSAQAAYHGYQRRWNAAARDLNLALKRMGGGVGNANQNFRRAESSVRGGWSG